MKPRLRERLRNSKNIVLFLSSLTANSRALKEEIEYGIINQKLPVVVIYPEYSEKSSLLNDKKLKQEIRNLWNNLPAFRASMNKVPTLHIPLKKAIIQSALNDASFVFGSPAEPKIYFYPS